MSKHYLITGGAGFIGSHLAERLLGDGHRVTVLDDFSTGRSENLDVARATYGTALRIIRDTVENETTVAMAMNGVDAVFHLASAVGVQLILDEPVRTIRTIIRGTEVVLDHAHRFGLPTLVTSSSEVYGKGSQIPFSEDDDIVMGPTAHARWCYAYAKGIDEFLSIAYHKQFGLPATTVRLFNTVGPRQIGRYGMVIPRFVEAAKSGRPLTVYGDGTQTRCFCHVLDVVDALVKLIDHPDAAGRVFNLGSDQEISIADLAAAIVKQLGSDSAVEHVSYEKAYGQQFDDLPRRVPDLSRLRGLIGFEPTRDLSTIIADVAMAGSSVG
ncbi:MAG: NAD-dependent epimerase/dehydratase family protein [Planctomycetota bacterium]